MPNPPESPVTLRFAAPGKPTKIVDLGPGVGRWQPYAEMRKTIDNDYGKAGRNHK